MNNLKKLEVDDDALDAVVGGVNLFAESENTVLKCGGCGKKTRFPSGTSTHKMILCPKCGKENYFSIAEHEQEDSPLENIVSALSASAHRLL